MRIMLILDVPDAADEATALATLDAFRDAACPGQHGVNLYRATYSDVRASGLMDRALRSGPVPEIFLPLWAARPGY